jgi:DNA-binding NtrC family response regulator
MRRLVADAEMATPDAAVALVVGERGTGKKRVARSLHSRWRLLGQFVLVDCAQMRPDDVRLFERDDPRLSGAKPGTLVLTNVEWLAQDLQRRLLSLASTLRWGQRLAWALIATTTVDLAHGVSQGAFDLRLYDLLRRTTLYVPPLRERRPDVPRLVRQLLSRMCEEDGEPPMRIDGDALDALKAYRWPENVAGLVDALDHALLAARGRERIELADLPLEVRGNPEPIPSERSPWPTLADVERRWIVETLRHFGGHQGNAADALGIHANTLGRKLKEYGLGRTRRRRSKGCPRAG